MIVALLLAAMAAQAGCADHWQVRLNTDSFANNGAGRTFSNDELEALRDRLEVQIKLAIGAACLAGVLPERSARSIRLVEATSASGATEPRLYKRGPDHLAFEWTFAEEGLAAPQARDIAAAAVCWTDPAAETCASEGD